MYHLKANYFTGTAVESAGKNLREKFIILVHHQLIFKKNSKIIRYEQKINILINLKLKLS